MSNVMLASCRSYSAQSFDGCPACVDSALEAVTQASMYLLGRAGQDISPTEDGQVSMAYTLGLSLCDDDGHEMGSDVIDVDQTVSAVQSDDEVDDANEVHPDDDERSSMRLEDFQTAIDKLQLSPAGRGGLSGVIVGRLYAYDRSIGLFEVAVAPQA
jgi:hypothetical protein